ncbi:MAG: hypothetical protein HYX78_08330 [Armatimonadetes bacterium]|nr:hypothetical protein [Armatimonadota bacterium]
MPDDKRVDIDDMGDLRASGSELLKDVQEATRLAKERKAKDKARDRELATKGRDRAVMISIIALAAVILLGVAYWMIFARGSSAQQNATNQASPAQSQPVTAPTYTPPAPRPAPGYTGPRRAAPMPQSEPVRRNPTDTYDNSAPPRGM